MKTKSHLAVRMLCEGVIMVVVAQILSNCKIWEIPWGGFVCVGMLPILFFACRWGIGPGLVSGLALGAVQVMTNGGLALGWQSIVCDYLLPFAVLGLAGLFRGKNYGIYLGTVVGSVARFVALYVVGATIWAESMPETLFGMAMTSPWVYYLLYHGFYMVIDMVLCLIIFAALYSPMKKFFLAEDIR